MPEFASLLVADRGQKARPIHLVDKHSFDAWLKSRGQEDRALLAAHRKWADLAEYDDPGAWVRRVVANRSASVWRRRSRELRAMSRLRARPVEVVGALDAPADEFWDAVRALPPRQAQCVALRYLDDRDVREIAEILEIAPATVRVHLHEARATLAVRLGEIEED